jgi:hypothetical protein
MSEGSPTRYRFGPLEKRGLVAGWRTGQALTVGAGLVIAVGFLRALPTAEGLAVAVVIVGICVAAATWPIAGRTAEEWVPDVARHGRHVALGRRWRAPVCATSPSPLEVRARGSRKRSRPEWRQRRGPFSGLRILEVDTSAQTWAPGTRTGTSRSDYRPLAVVHDPVGRTYTAVVPASGPGFVLLGSTDRERRVAGWAAALAGFARQGTPIHRVQWIARTLPANGAGTGARQERLSPTVGGSRSGGPSDAEASYQEFVATTIPGISRHQVFIAVSVRAGHGVAGRQRWSRSGSRERSASCAVLMRELAAFRRRLADAEVHSAPALAPRALASVIRTGFTSSRWEWPQESGTSWPWPVATEVHWDSVRTDATWQATYWVSEWPRTDVGTDFLAPLLVSGDLRQTVAVTMEPISPLEAARKAQQARTADVADAQLRQKGGFLRTARRRREEETLADREIELADGHAPFRFSGYVTVSAEDRDELEESCGSVEQAAGRAGMELRRCFGNQQDSFTFSLPLCRGLD